MSSPDDFRISRTQADDCSPPVWPSGPMSTEEFARWTTLVANGEVAFPGHLPPAEAERLLRAVRQSRRTRLIRYLARAIAADIHRVSDQ